jgi:hypothetical protein
MLSSFTLTANVIQLGDGGLSEPVSSSPLLTS